MNAVKNSLLCVAGFILAVGIVAQFTSPDYYAALQRSHKKELLWQIDGVGSTPELEDYYPLHFPDTYCPVTLIEIMDTQEFCFDDECFCRSPFYVKGN